jgi:Cu-Zn family superoxide dismutase
MKTRSLVLVCGLLVASALALAASDPPVSSSGPALVAQTSMPSVPAAMRAVAVIHPTEGNTVSGVVTFAQTATGVHIEAHLSGLTPGSHGFHIHEFGDCSAPDGTSAGGHFNPDGAPHAGPTDAARHVGDMGNIEAGADGTATLAMDDNMMSFDGPHGIIGRGIIVHANADDLTSQPSGNAGPRVACGVIGVAQSAQ